MNKIPVRNTLAFAYGFLFGKIGTILGIAWLPVLIAFSADYGARSYSAAYRTQIEAGDAGAGGTALFLSIAALTAMVLASSAIAAGIMREVWDRPGGTRPLLAPFGRTEWRLFGANMVYLVGSSVLLLIAVGISMLAFYLAGVPAGSVAAPPMTPAVILAMLISWAAFLYAFYTIVRMGFLLPPVIAASEKGSLRSAYDLAQGNFWRISAVVMGLGLPILALLMAAEFVLLREALGPDFLNLTGDDAMRRIVEAQEQKLLVWQVFGALIYTLASGLFYSAAAYAYRVVADGGERPSIPHEQ